MSVDLRKTPKLDKLDVDQLLSLLDEVAVELEETNERARQLYELRTRIYVEARDRQPPVTLRKIAAHARTTDVAVNAVLQKAKAS